MNRILLTIFIFFFGLSFSAEAQIIDRETFDLEGGEAVGEKDLEDQPLTQEEFATELVDIMQLEELLPVAALPSDYTHLLDRLGVAPLNGWDNKAFLTREDYLVIIGKAQGKEGVVHRRAVAIEQKNIDAINQKWQQAYDQTGSWPSLSELLNNPAYFPHGAPKSPYGITYKDVNGNHQVDPIFLPAADLMELREFLSTE
jgi:hypothetical protein